MIYNNKRIVWYIQSSPSNVRTCDSFVEALTLYNQIENALSLDPNRFKAILWSQELPVIPKLNYDNKQDDDE